MLFGRQWRYILQYFEYILPRVVYFAEMAVKPPFLIFALVLIKISVLYLLNNFLYSFSFLKKHLTVIGGISCLNSGKTTFLLDFGHVIIFGFTFRNK